jgi:hypothetical protein
VMKAKPAAAKGKYLKSLTVSSTMGPAWRSTPRMSKRSSSKGRDHGCISC